MDLDASNCSNYYDFIQISWIIYLMISFHVSLANVNLHMRFSTTVWNNFESGWEFHDLSEQIAQTHEYYISLALLPYLNFLRIRAALKSLYYASLNARLPSSNQHLRLMRTTQRIPTDIISHPDFKQRHSSVFTSRLYIMNTLSLVVDYEVWEIRWYIEIRR